LASAEQAVFLYELLGLGIPEGLRGYYDALGPVFTGDGFALLGRFQILAARSE
jgi:hypothetical protein